MITNNKNILIFLLVLFVLSFSLTASFINRGSDKTDSISKTNDSSNEKIENSSNTETEDLFSTDYDETKVLNEDGSLKKLTYEEWYELNANEKDLYIIKALDATSILVEGKSLLSNGELPDGTKEYVIEIVWNIDGAYAFSEDFKKYIPLNYLYAIVTSKGEFLEMDMGSKLKYLESME